MYANRITITEVEQLVKEIFGNCTITDCYGLHKISLGHGQTIYANDQFVDAFHKEMLRQIIANNFNKSYNNYYRNEG